MNQFIRLTYVEGKSQFYVNVGHIVSFRDVGDYERGEGIGCVLHLDPPTQHPYATGIPIREGFADVLKAINIANSHK